MKMLNRFTVLILLTLAVGCAQLGVPSPETFNEKLAVSVSAVTAVRTTATTLLGAKKISADDAQNINRQADAVREALDVARTMAKADLPGADNKLTAARSVLTALQSYLATKGN